MLQQFLCFNAISFDIVSDNAKTLPTTECVSKPVWRKHAAKKSKLAKLKELEQEAKYPVGSRWESTVTKPETPQQQQKPQRRGSFVPSTQDLAGQKGQLKRGIKKKYELTRPSRKASMDHHFSPPQTRRGSFVPSPFALDYKRSVLQHVDIVAGVGPPSILNSRIKHDNLYEKDRTVQSESIFDSNGRGSGDDETFIAHERNPSYSTNPYGYSMPPSDDMTLDEKREQIWMFRNTSMETVSTAPCAMPSRKQSMQP
jgi:hypothetical protein